MPRFIYEVMQERGRPPESGEVEAPDAYHAKRDVIMKYGLADPDNAIVWELEAGDEGQGQGRRRAFTLQYLLDSLRDHHQWITDVQRGNRAELRGLDLSGVSLSGRPLQMVCLASANLRGADLSNANLENADLSEANLSRANLSGANLRKADLSDADLRDADLSGAELDGADVWRANFRGCRIAPAALHRALNCELPEA